ncbi:hypothetical protein NT2_14_00420 [Caenibius tardaugens NBRC 16725]|uniref:Uncharacterized protein n=2 Tax=Caenibius TaxID=2827482 RepID=U3A8F3_9SPHN|nr:hypothetical protein NT2_14_00420 [Caenibius tardaugens NBRC 16725]
MSLAMTMISTYYALRGSDVIVVPPKQVILFRDGNGAGSIMSIVARFDMINASADYGDVLLNISAQVGKNGPRYDYSAPAKAIFTNDVAAAADDCASDSRCIPLTGLMVAEQPDDMFALGGGAARTTTLVFPMAEWNCKGEAAQCGKYSTFEKSLTSIGKNPLSVEFSLKFHSDGARKIVCVSDAAVDSQYLQNAGWISFACQNPS